MTKIEVTNDHVVEVTFSVDDISIFSGATEPLTMKFYEDDLLHVTLNECLRRPTFFGLGEHFYKGAALDRSPMLPRVRPRMMLDAGAHSGVFSIIAAKLFPTTKVVAIECHPKLAERIRLHAEMNGVADRVEVIQKALWSKRGQQIPMGSVWEANTGMTSFQFGNVANADVFAVETTSFPELKEQYGNFDFVKMDIEGAEFEVLAGLDLDDYVDALYIEYHADFRFTTAMNFAAVYALKQSLTDRGFSLYDMPIQAYFPHEEEKE